MGFKKPELSFETVPERGARSHLNEKPKFSGHSRSPPLLFLCCGLEAGRGEGSQPSLSLWHQTVQVEAEHSIDDYALGDQGAVHPTGVTARKARGQASRTDFTDSSRHVTHELDLVG